MENGFFITTEGCEGGGKTTAIRKIKEVLERKGHRVIITREPGGVPTAEKIREVLLNNTLTSISEMYLFGAARFEHLHHVVNPALEKGLVVICDRFYDSSIVYQGHVGGLGMDYVYEFNKTLVKREPDLTLYFDVDVEVGLNRIFSNSDREVSKYDMKDTEYHEKVREGYLLLMDKPYGGSRIKKVDANQSIENVENQLEEIFKGVTIK